MIGLFRRAVHAIRASWYIALWETALFDGYTGTRFAARIPLLVVHAALALLLAFALHLYVLVIR